MAGGEDHGANAKRQGKKLMFHRVCPFVFVGLSRPGHPEFRQAGATLVNLASDLSAPCFAAAIRAVFPSSDDSSRLRQEARRNG
jgi:hypothetical protein